MQPLSNAKAELNELEELIDGERKRREQYMLRYNIVLKTIDLLKSQKLSFPKSMREASAPPLSATAHYFSARVRPTF